MRQVNACGGCLWELFFETGEETKSGSSVFYVLMCVIVELTMLWMSSSDIAKATDIWRGVLNRVSFCLS